MAGRKDDDIPERVKEYILADGKFSKGEVELLEGFCRKAQNGPDRASEIRLIKFITTVKMCLRASNKSLSAMLKSYESFENATNSIWKFKGKTKFGNQGFSFDSKKDMVKILGRVFNWKKNKDSSLKYAPVRLKQLCEVKRKPNEDPVKFPMLTRQDIRELVSVADDVFDRALIFTLFEAGCRPSEFLKMKKSDVQQTDKGIVLHIPKTKTDERYCPVVECKRYLNDFLNSHPSKSEDAYLWTSPFTGDVLCQRALQKRITKVKGRYERKMGRKLNKPICLKHFRKSRVTEFISLGGTPSQCSDYFGHSIATAMRHYHGGVPLEQMQNTVNAMHGEAPPEITQAITHWQCLRCEEKNSMAALYCPACGSSRNASQEAIENMDLKKRSEKLEEEMKALKKQQAETMRLLTKEIKKRVS